MSFTFSKSESVFSATMVSNQLNLPIDGTKEYLTIGWLGCFFLCVLFSSSLSFHLFSTRIMMVRSSTTLRVIREIHSVWNLKWKSSAQKDLKPNLFCAPIFACMSLSIKMALACLDHKSCRFHTHEQRDYVGINCQVELSVLPQLSLSSLCG